jgi:hypothetical protein
MANGNGSGSKYDKAVDRATHGPGADAAVVPVKNMDAFITKGVTDEQMKAILDDPALEFAPQIYKLEQGEMVAGVLEGNGPSAEFEHDAGHGVMETNEVKTWIIASQDGRQRISILSSVQLDRKLPPFVGGFVKIVRGKDINIAGARRVTDYMVAGTKVAGKIRNWSSTPAIEAHATETKQLPEGTPAATEHHAS